jgi:basic endochitinase B
MARSVLAASALLLAVAAQGVGSTITEAMYNSMLPNRDNSLCPAKGFYTYNAFITAANSFPAFGTSGGSAELMKRELSPPSSARPPRDHRSVCVALSFSQYIIGLFVAEE